MNALIHRLRDLAATLLFLACVSLFAGCYTALRHPATPDLTGEPVSHRMSCGDCHDEAAFYHHHYGMHYDYYGTPWFGYYSEPWWFGSDWYLSGPASPEPLDSDERRSWSRGAPYGSARGATGSSTGPAYLKPGYSKKAHETPDKPKEGEKQAEEKKSKSRRPYQRGKKK
jgi:hypothetical protein